jgi:hypothetical protein
MQAQEENLVPPTFNPTNRSCNKCGHLAVCKIYAFEARLLKEEFGEKPPFKAEEIAKICGEYNPLRQVTVIREETAHD